ncbi:MAG: Ig-like domain-containing protein, partial [Anaerolineales bacterium]|nr:Ig-like domain-containing protein [Anaerolineales bacterium]
TDIAFDATINSTKTVITIDPTADFASEQTVYVAISASLEDALDHAAPAASASLKIKDVIPPIVTFDPSNGSQDIAANRNITLTFSEPIRNVDNSEISDTNVGGLISLKATNASGGDFNFTATINTEKKVITVDPLFDFSPNSTVYVAIGATVEDDADNAISATSSIFMTGIPDVIGPAVTNVTSANADSSYKDGSSII